MGILDRYTANHEPLGFTGVLWNPDGSVIDLMQFMDPATGWIRIQHVSHIDDANWVSGIGLFDPDGAGVGTAAYARFFLMQVPEPATLLAGMAFSAAGLRRRRPAAR